MKFTAGTSYTRRQIHTAVGGSIQSYLPNRAGRVVAACLRKDVNPQAPEVVLVSKKPKIEEAGALLAQQSEAIPVFIKMRTNEWVYEGEYRVAASYTSSFEMARFEGASDGNTVRVIVLKQKS